STKSDSFEHLERWTLETRQRHITNITQVLTALRGSVEPACRQVAVQREESRGCDEFRRCFLDVTDVVADRDLLLPRELNECLPSSMAARCFSIEPLKTVEHRLAVLALPLVRCTDPFVQENDYACFGGTWRGGIRWNDQVAQHLCQASLAWCEGQRPQL